MSVSCTDLVTFADGELQPQDAAAFRCHLATCERCQRNLAVAVALGIRLETLTAVHDPVEPALPRESAGTGAPASSRGEPAAPADPTGAREPIKYSTGRAGAPPRPREPVAAPARRIAALIAPLLAAAVLTLALLHPSIPGFLAPPSPGRAAPNVFVDLTRRPFDTRLSSQHAARYLPRSEMLGATSGRERISHDALAALERSGDRHALEIAMAWNGENPSDAVDQLRALEQTDAVRSDIVALEIPATKNDNVEPLLAELEALRKSADLHVAAAARWNHAVLLARLDLPHSAAREFRAIADTHEAGWAEEARDRAAAAAATGQDAQRSWESAHDAGKHLASEGTPVPVETIRRFPGLMRAWFYNAVRAAPSRERVLALEPMAVELDRIDGQTLLRDHVRRIAGLDFGRRAPLASAYRRLLRSESITAEVRAALTASQPSRDVADIVMGTLVHLELAVDRLDAFEALVKQAGDPWFEIVFAVAGATADIRRSSWLGAEARLLDARKRCSAAISYQCMILARQLGKLYQDLHRIPEAIAVLQDALRTAKRSGEWGRYRELLWYVADVERFHSSTATARAYANEVLHLGGKRCDYARTVHSTLTGAAVIDVDGRAARRELEAQLALPCATPDLLAANYLTDIARLDPQPGDLARLQHWLTQLRASETLTPADRILADEIEGRLLIEHDRAAGIIMLEAVIAAARALPRDVIAHKARAGAYSVLVLDAARNGEAARTLALTAEQLDLAPPSVCAVAMVAEDERAAIVVRGADGQDRLSYDHARKPRAGALTVPAAHALRLRACPRVQVLANAAVQGQSQVLPPTVAWSYATGAHRDHSRPRQAARFQTLVVTNVTAPPQLGLPSLLPRTPARDRSIRILSGPEATPSAVLAAMTEAPEIHFHTHALVDLGVSDASHLVLSSDAGGRYALTAEAIRNTELRRAPIVVLGACHSAQGARYQHAPWSLPHAFLMVGARGVLAAGTEIPDSESWPFFARVLERIRGGADPAAALRDERINALAADPATWVADVILFE